MYKRSPGEKDRNEMTKQNNVPSLNDAKNQKLRLWKDAIKWPLYSIAVMPVVLAAGWKLGHDEAIQFGQFLGFLSASILLLLWENLTNDLFDSDTGVDEKNKPHSVVALVGRKQPIQRLASFVLILGLIIIYFLALKSNNKVFYLTLGSCCLGYLYQGPPFRLGYKGLGEPLCWIAFGPFATAAGLLVLSPRIIENSNIPWEDAFILGSGPALATTLVLFCSHFHQVTEDKANGKNSPLVRLGTHRAASLIPWIIVSTFTLELVPIIYGNLPITSLLSIISICPAISLIKLLREHHDEPKLIYRSKFLALRFQALNGFSFSIGIALAPILGLN